MLKGQERASIYPYSFQYSRRFARQNVRQDSKLIHTLDQVSIYKVAKVYSPMQKVATFLAPLLDWKCLVCLVRVKPGTGNSATGDLPTFLKHAWLPLQCHTQKRIGGASALFGYDNNKDLKVCFLVMRVYDVHTYRLQ